MDPPLQQRRKHVAGYYRCFRNRGCCGRVGLRHYRPLFALFGPALVRGPSNGRRVALTFDDGPALPFTEQILDILRERKRRPVTEFLSPI